MTYFGNALLVDDDPTCNFLNELWISHTGLAAQVRTYTNPDEALAFIASHYLNQPQRSPSPDLLLLDIDLGATTGFDLLDQLAALGELSECSLLIFILSSSIALPDVEKARRYHLAGYLEKPLSEEHIGQIIQVLTSTRVLSEPK
jgi:CheY-like chemotaxis protein